MKTKFSKILTLLLAFVVQITFAQQQPITGTVVDESGLPLPGVNIIVKGTSTGVQTDFDGNYSISASQGDVLVYSFIGLETAERTVGSSNTIDITLNADSAQLQEVVVTAFGGTKQKRATTYATSTIDDEELNRVPSSSAFESLSGKIAGADITTPAQPGASSKVIIRGFTSISGYNQPLYIIDGTPINFSTTGSTGNSISRSYDAGNGISDLIRMLLKK